MVEIKKQTPGRQVQRRRIGVVATRASSEKVYEQEARNFQQASNIALEYAKNLQIEEGKEYGRTVAVRDEEGNLSYPSMPATLGRFGAQAAEEIAQRNFALAVQNDFQEFANQTALEVTDPNLYKARIANYITETSKNIEQSGGASIIPSFTETAYAYSSQQANKIALNSYKIKEETVRAQARKFHEGMASEIRSLRRDGTEDSLKEADNLERVYRQELNNSISLQGFSQEYVADRNRELDGVKVTSGFQGVIKGLSLQQAEELQVALVSGIDPQSYAKKYPELFEQYNNLPEQVFTSVASEINMTMTRLKSLYGSSTKKTNAKNWLMGGAFGSGKTERGYTDIIIEDQFQIDAGSFPSLVQSGVLESPRFNNLTRRLGALPSVMHDSIEAFAHGGTIEGIQDLNALRSMTNAALNAVRDETGQIRQKGLSDEAIGYLLAVEEHFKAYGVSNESMEYAFQRIPRLLDDEDGMRMQVARKLEIKKPGKKDAVQLATESLQETFPEWNPQSYNQYGSVYAMLLTQASKEVAQTKIENLYNSTYQEYNWHFPTYGGGENKFRYTPRYYYSDAKDHVTFVEQIQNLGAAAYKQAGGEVNRPVFGVHFFIKSSPFNRPDYGEFMIVDENGKAFLNNQSRPVMINTDTVQTAQTDFAKAEEDKIRQIEIAEMLDRFDKLPTEFGKPFAEGGMPLMGR